MNTKLIFLCKRLLNHTLASFIFGYLVIYVAAVERNDFGRPNIIDFLDSIKGPYGVGLRHLEVAITFHSPDPASISVEIHQTDAGRNQR